MQSGPGICLSFIQCYSKYPLSRLFAAQDVNTVIMHYEYMGSVTKQQRETVTEGSVK